MNKSSKKRLFFGVFVSVQVLISTLYAAGQDPFFVRTMDGYSYGVKSVLFSHNGQQIVSGGSRAVCVWNTETGEEEAGFGMDVDMEAIDTIAMSPNGVFIAVGLGNGVIKLWNTISREYEKTFVGTSGVSSGIHALVFNSDGSRIFSGERSGQIRVWDVETGTCTMNLMGHESQVYSLVLSHDDMHLVSGGADGLIKIWDIEVGVCKKAFENDLMVKSIGLSSDDTYIVSCDALNFIKIWNVASGTCEKILHSDRAVSDVVFSSDGRYVFASCDADIKIWDVETGEWCVESLENGRFICCIACSSDGKYIVSGDEGERILYIFRPNYMQYNK